MKGHEWLSSLKQYEGADNKKSLLQLTFTFILYFTLIAAMFALVLLKYSYCTVLLLSVPAAGFHVKIFIIFHDCCHGSYFKTSRQCFIAGQVCGIITFTPFFDWQRSHAIHHASVSNLEKRGIGDLWTMTVDEDRSAPMLKKIQGVQESGISFWICACASVSCYVQASS